MLRYVALVAALGACTKTTAKVGLVISGAFVVGGAFVAAEPPHGLGPQPDDVGHAMMVIGAVIAIPCIIKLSWPPPPPYVDPVEAHRRDIVQRREQAWRLTQEAETAARNGNCHVALDLGAQIATLDTGVHDSVYLRDAAIVRCTAQ